MFGQRTQQKVLCFLPETELKNFLTYLEASEEQNVVDEATREADTYELCEFGQYHIVSRR